MTAGADETSFDPIPGGLQIREGAEVYDLLLSPAARPVETFLLEAALGVVGLAPESPGKVRAVEVLSVGDARALALAQAVAWRRLSGG